MSSKHVVVLGGGFAGLWSALGAARKLDEMGLGREAAGITLINPDPYHCIRVRNYEVDLSSVRVPLNRVLDPIGVEHIEATVTAIDFARQVVHCKTTAAGQSQSIGYDRLVFALGSQLNRPAIPGSTEYGFDVDTYNGAARLNSHLQSLPSRPESPGQFNVLVVGTGLTGIEVATEMTQKLKLVVAKARAGPPFRVMLADRSERVGSDMGESARPVIERALRDLHIESRVGVSVAAIDASGAALASGERIPAATLVWCTGMRANPLTRSFPVECDPFDRLPVDEFMRVKGMKNVFAAGDSAWTTLDSDFHISVMSCQHSRPMGRFAGHNVISDLFGKPMLPLHIDWYVTVLDLGTGGAVYTEGWDRIVVSTGAAAKRTKHTINCQRIYPPLSGSRREILDAAAPLIQTAPAVYR